MAIRAASDADLAKGLAYIKPYFLQRYGTESDYMGLHSMRQRNQVNRLPTSAA